MIYFYVISYIRLYNAYNACYQEGITYRFANWPFSCRASPNTTQKRVVPCRSSCCDPRHGTALTFVSCRHVPKFIVLYRAPGRAKMSCFVRPINSTALSRSSSGICPVHFRFSADFILSVFDDACCSHVFVSPSLRTI
jgi:hypothetical protein